VEYSTDVGRIDVCCERQLREVDVTRDRVLEGLMTLSAEWN